MSCPPSCLKTAFYYILLLLYIVFIMLLYHILSLIEVLNAVLVRVKDEDANYPSLGFMVIRMF